MTAPTHGAFGFLLAALFGMPLPAAFASAIGALLPDIDHPQSSMGRLLFFISHPLNARFGHRQFIHSFILWSPLLIIGIVHGGTTGVVTWLALGAWSHILIDAHNVSGVKAFLPFSDKPVVCFKRDWRVVTGSVKEIVIFVMLMAGIGCTNYAYEIGGPRKLINLALGSPKIMAQEYKRAGLKICNARGTFRWADGRTMDVEWLVVGTNGQHLVYWTGNRIVRNPEHGEFKRARLSETDQAWAIVQVDGIATAVNESFFFDGKVWRHAAAGSPVMGTVKSVDFSPPKIRPYESEAFPGMM